MTYGRFHEATILEVVNPPYLFCFSYGDINGGEVKVVSLKDFPLYKREPRNDKRLVKELYKVMSSADILVAHNINFDVRIARARFIYHKLPPIKPVKTICTLKLARRIGLFPANTLKEVALFLGVTHKMETSKNLWQKIHFDRDPKAWKEMCLYNKVDTVAGRQIYKILRGWDSRPPNEVLGAKCECGSNNIRFRGLTRGKRPGKRFVCSECGKWGHLYLTPAK